MSGVRQPISILTDGDFGVRSSDVGVKGWRYASRAGAEHEESERKRQLDSASIDRMGTWRNNAHAVCMQVKERWEYGEETTTTKGER